MIFVFIEDGTLDVIDDINQARKEYEGIDVESEVYKFYNEEGTYLKPMFSVKNRTKKHFFGLFSSVESGEYELVATEDPKTDTFQIMLLETNFLNENAYFKSLKDIKNKYNKT